MLPFRRAHAGRFRPLNMDVTVACLPSQEAHGIFIRMLGMEGKKTITSEDVEGRPRWAKVEPIIRTYVGNTLEVTAA